MTEPNAIVEALTTPTQEPEKAPVQEPEAVTSVPDSSEGQSPSGDETEAKPAPRTVKDWATAHEIDPKEIYELVDGQGKSLSDLSNKARDFDKLDVRTTEQARAEAEFRAQQAKFNEYVADWSALVESGQNDPAALERLQAQKVEHLKAQETQTLQVIPEWGDLTVKTADQQRINAFASKFGGPSDTAEQLTAPWANLMMRYVLTLEDQFQAALQKVEKVRNKPLPTTGKSTRPSAPPDGLNVQAQALLKGLQNG